MNKTKQVFSVLMILILLLAACVPGDLPDDPTAAVTALIATATRVANLISTDTPVPPTATPALPTDTSVPAATSTPLPESTQPSSPPTDTPAPPTETPVPPTATSIPPTATSPAVAGELCPSWVHARHVTAAPDGKNYPTWHPQIDPDYGCYFDHEHGDDPRTSLANPAMPPFGYIGAQMNPPMDEAHAGFKVFVTNKGVTNDEGRTALNSSRVVAHMGTGGVKRFDEQFHSLIFDLVAEDGHYAHVQGMADTGQAGSICDRSHNDQQGRTVVVMPGTGCDLKDSLYEIWLFELRIGDKLMVLVSTAVFDPITVMNPADHTQLIYTTDAFASRANEAPFTPPLNGCNRESYHGPVYWYNSGGATTYNTDGMGMIMEGAPLLQEISAHSDIGIMMNQDQKQMKFRVDYCASGLGLKN